LVLLVLLHLVLSVDLEHDTLRITPFGRIPASCVHKVPNGAHIDESESGIVKVFTAEGDLLRIIPQGCNTRELLAKYAKRQDYDGWLAYTTAFYQPGFDAFLGYFTVPPDPQSTPDVLYLFTGLQNVDWIPIVDPQPPVFDIIQPVLQYPGDESGSDWGVKNWYVTLNSGVLTSDEIGVSAGDNIFGNMTRIQGSTWFIGGTSTQTGQTCALTVTRPRLMTQPWAYNTAEGYGVGDCTYEPTGPCVFSQLQLYAAGQLITPTWTPSVSPNPKCNEKATINSASQVTITFQ